MSEHHLDQLLETEGVLGFHFHCAELDSGIQIQVTEEKKASCQIKYIGPEDEAVDFLLRALGGFFENEEEEVEYQPPYTYPRYNFLVATNGSIQFHGKPQADSENDGELIWPYSTVTINFETKKYPTSGEGANRTLTVKSSPQVIEIEGGKAHFVTSGVEVNAPFGIDFAEIELRYSMVKAPSMGDANHDLVNHVNDDTFLGKPAGTVLFAEYDAEQSEQGIGEQPEYKRNYVLKYKSVGWLNELDFSTGDFDEVIIGIPGSSSTRRKHNEADLSGIFD